MYERGFIEESDVKNLQGNEKIKFVGWTISWFYLCIERLKDHILNFLFPGWLVALLQIGYKFPEKEFGLVRYKTFFTQMQFYNQ